MKGDTTIEVTQGELSREAFKELIAETFIKAVENGCSKVTIEFCFDDQRWKQWA